MFFLFDKFFQLSTIGFLGWEGILVFYHIDMPVKVIFVLNAGHGVGMFVVELYDVLYLQEAHGKNEKRWRNPESYKCLYMHLLYWLRWTCPKLVPLVWLCQP